MGTRILICVVGLLLWGVGSLATVVGQRAQAADKREIEQLRSRLVEVGGMDVAAPDQALRLLEPVLFHPNTMWRLTVYVLESEDGELSLRRGLRCASSEIYESTGRDRISVERSFFRDIFTAGLPFSNQAADGPDRNLNPQDWIRWQTQVVQDETVAGGLRMPSRKYAWCAVREQGSQGRTIALMAETVQPGGIKVDQLEAPLMEPLLSLVVRLTELPDVVNPVVENTNEVLDRLG